MKRLPDIYRLILEAEVKQEPEVTAPPSELPTPQEFYDRLGARNPRLEIPRFGGWDYDWQLKNPNRPFSADNQYVPPQRWPKFPNGQPWPRNPPSGWPGDVTYPPPPGHPVYEILQDFTKGIWEFNWLQGGHPNWNNIPDSIKQKFFNSYAERRRYLMGNDQSALYGLNLLGVMLFAGGAWASGGIIPLLNQGPLGRLGTATDIMDIVTTTPDVFQTIPTDGLGPKPLNPNPWGGYWPWEPNDTPPPPGWYYKPSSDPNKPGKWFPVSPSEIELPPNWNQHYQLYWDPYLGKYVLTPITDNQNYQVPLIYEPYPTPRWIPDLML